MKNITQSGFNDKGNILASKTKNSTINVDIKHSLTKDLVIFLFNYLGPHLQYPQTVFLQACLIAAFNSKGYMPLCSHQGQRESFFYKSPEFCSDKFVLGFPGGTGDKEPTCQCRRHKRRGFDPCSGKILWRRAWQPTAVFLPEESHGQRNLVDYGP